MIIVVIVLSLIIALISLATNFRNKSIQYFGIIWILIGLSCIKPAIEEHVFSKYFFNTHWESVLKLFGILCSSVSLNFSPYFYLLFGLSCSNLWEEENGLMNKKAMTGLAIILPVISFIVFFSRGLFFYSDNLNFLLVSLWAVPYYMAGIFFLIHSYYKSSNKREKDQALLLCYLSIPASIAAVITSYILRVFGVHNAWLLNRWMAIFVTFFYLYLISRYGFLGIKLRIEKLRLDNTMKAVMSGTAILNHTIKNEVLKILISVNNVNNTKDRYSKPFEDDLQVILNSARHLESMAKRIQENMGDIELLEEEHNLADIIENSLRLVDSHLIRKKIKISKEYSTPTMLRCDELHVKELLINILQNAIEAIKDEGEIQIKVEKSVNYILISIRDNGEGIPKELLPYIMDPFFSTKEKHINYGIGLSYCYNVIRKHGGTIEIDSELSMGTTVWLKFPTRKNKLKTVLGYKEISA